MRYELFTAFRYLKSKKDNLFISKLLVISILTVTLAITVPIIVLSVINGFHKSIKDKIVGTNFQIRVKHKYDNFVNYKKLLKDFKEDPDVDIAIPYFEAQGLIKMENGDSIRSVLVKAYSNEDIEKNVLFRQNFKILTEQEFPTLFFINPKRKKNDFKKNLLDDQQDKSEKKNNQNSNINKKSDNSLPLSSVEYKGKKESKAVELDPFPKSQSPRFQVEKKDAIIIGDALSKYIKVTRGSKIKLLIPQGDIQLDADPENFKTLYVNKIYSAGYAKFNRALVFIHKDAIEEIFQFRNLPTDIGINLHDRGNASDFVAALKEKYDDIIVTNTLEEGLFKDFAQEKKMMSLLLYFLIFSAFLTIYIALHVVVMDKRREIGILKAIGSKTKSIQMIFVFEGLLISFTGVIMGNLLGILITTSLKEIVNFIEDIVNGGIGFVYLYFGDLIGMNYPSSFYIMDPNVFYLDTFPYQFSFTDILLQSVGAIFVALLAAYFPSKKASYQKPADSLRF